MTQFILHDETKRLYGKSICRETAIPEKGVLIIAPSHRLGLSAARIIEEKFHSKGLNAKVLEDPTRDILISCGQPAIVLGNLSNSKCVEYMVYKYLCMTDLSYPGRGGYNIRTLTDPFATGYNVLHIGYSDDAGLEKGVQAFIRKTDNPLPYMNEVEYEELPYSESYLKDVRHAKVPEKIDLVPSIHTSQWHVTGLLAYVTGDLKIMETYFEGWHKMVEISKENSFLIKATHLYMTAHIEIWRLLELSGMIPDDVRLSIEKCVFDWAQSKEGVGYARNISRQKDLPSHNHTMFCAMSLIYAHDYFSKRYPELKYITDEWKQVGDDVFYVFNHNGWKPLCDDSSYSNQVTLRLVCSYSIFEDEHRFLNTSAKEAAKWIKAIIGQNAMMPSYGDGSVKSPFPTVLSAIFTHYISDGEMQWLYDRFKNLNNGQTVSLQRLFDSGVIPKEHEDMTGITRIMLDKYSYTVWEKNPKQAKQFSTTPPEGPYEDCFDKVSIRTGWDKIHDDFLLIDGLGSNGVHAYSDAMGVLDFTSKGIVWLVEENDYRWPEPENCSILTIARNGYASEVPGYALLEEQTVLDQNRYYLRMRLKNYNGTDWIREIYLIKGVCAIFHDTVICNQEGEFIINAHFRTPSKVQLWNQTAKALRRNRERCEYELRLSGYSNNNISMNVEEIPYGKRLFDYGGMYDEDEKKTGNKTTKADIMWESRYHDKDVVVSSITSMSSSYMKEGDKLSLTHIVQPAKQDEASITPKFEGKALVIFYAGKEDRLPLSHIGNCCSTQEKASCKSHVNKVKIHNECTFDRKICTLSAMEDNQTACALEGGKVVLTDHGNILWELSFEGSIHVMEYVKPEKLLIIGHGHNKLSAVDLKGQLVWETRTTRIPTLYDSWELAYPQIVSIRTVETKDGLYILTGAGDNQVRVYDTKGKMHHAFYIYATVPDILEWIDVDHDGEPEVLASGKVDSAYGMFYSHTITGKPKRDVRTGFWLNTIQSHRLVTEGDKHILVCGMKYQENFKVVSIEKDGVKTEFDKRLGGIVKAVEIKEDHSEVYAGTSKGSVMAFDRKGNQVWSVYVEDSVNELYRKQDNTICVVCEYGRISVIDRDGNIISTGNLPGVSHSFKVEDKIYIACDQKLFSI